MPQRQVVWIVSELYYPEVTSTGLFLTQIAEGLASDFTVHALCAQPTYSQRGTRAPADEYRNGVQIRRVSATSLNKDKVAFRLLNLLTISLAMFLTAVRQFRRGDIVISVTNPPTLPYLMAVAARLRGARLIVLVHDVYPELFVRLEVLPPASLLVRAIDKASIALYNRAEKIIVLGRDMAALIRPKLRSRPERILLAPHWASPSVAPQPAATSRLRSRLGFENKFIVQYTGNIGRTHGIEDLMEAATLLTPEPVFQFLLIGSGGKRRWAEEQCKRRSLPNFFITDYVPLEELSDTLAAADIAVISLSRGMGGISVPSRMYNALASGRPILAICDADSELARVVLEENVGWVIAPGDPAEVARILQYAVASPDVLAVMGHRARLAAERSYTFDNILGIYRHAIGSMIT